MSEDFRSNAWVKIEDFIHQICSFHYISPTEYIEFYTIIYDYISDCIAGKFGPKHETDAAAAALYHHIEMCLRKKLDSIYQNVNDMSDGDILQHYKEHWSEYKRMCLILNGACKHLSQYWIQRQLPSASENIYEIDVLSQQIWEEYFFKALFSRLIRTCLDMIIIHRNNHSSVDTQSIKNILQLFLDNSFLEIIKNDLKITPDNDIYTECFEAEFLREAQDFYCQQIVPSFESSRLFEYLISIEQYYEQERNLARSYLPEEKSTLKKLIDILGVVIPDNTLNIILEKVNLIISQKDNYQELARLYKPISRIPKIQNKLVMLIENHIYQVGFDAIQLVSETAINDPKVYIKTIVDIRKKLWKFVEEIFHGEQKFTAAFDKACGKFINNNAVTQTVGNTPKSPELLARYCDILLRKGTKTVEETDLEEDFNQMMVIFNSIEDKDVYQKFYGKMLAKRLIGQLSTSDNYEESMISKLKQTCGCEYTSKFERMIQDISVSKTLIAGYENYCIQRQVADTVNFSVMVLTSNSWPFSASTNIILPIEFKSTFDSFTEFYTHRHNGRKLTWLHQHSRGELQTFFTSQKYTLQVSVYQMVVLLLFNKGLTWTVARIQDQTEMKSEILIQILCSLLKSRILVCAEIKELFDEVPIQMNFTIQLATDFISDKFRLNLNVPLKSIEQKDVKGVDKTINEERKMIIQATIVRIMKAQQTLKHALLMQEVIQQLNSRFKPNIPVVKKCVDLLIEKEYLERDLNDKDLLRYLA